MTGAGKAGALLLPRCKSGVLARRTLAIAPGVFFRCMKRKCSCDVTNVFRTNACDTILDMRGYPDYHVTDSIIPHFSKEPVQWGDFRCPLRYFPNQEHVIYKEKIRYLPVSDDFIDTPVYVLINHKAMSYAETVIEIIRRSQTGTLAGQPTAGTNGDITFMHLPVFGFSMTAVKDFSGCHGKGIQPDIPVQPTLEAIREGRDELLETAILLLKASGMDSHN
jgi:hypothetical protein